MKNPTRKIIIGTSVIAVIILSAAAFAAYYVYNHQATNNPQLPQVAGYKNTTYTIEGSQVKLVNGISTTPIENSSASVVTTYFGNELFKDLNDDGRDDVVFLLTQQTGGSGTFYYVVAALNTTGGYIGSHALLLDDRISPQTTESGPGKQVIVNYVQRALNEPVTNPPSVAKSIALILDIPSMIFGVVASNFEGEADPDRMTLSMKQWDWSVPKFSLTFTKSDDVTDSGSQANGTRGESGTVTVGTDCNSVGGEYKVNDNKIAFTNIVTTKMFCEGSKETEFLKMISKIETFRFTGKGELVFSLKDGGEVVFR